MVISLCVHHCIRASLHLGKGIDDMREQGGVQMAWSVAIVLAPGRSHHRLTIVRVIGNVTVLSPVCGVHGKYSKGL